MSIKEDLRPLKHQRVMDLVEQAGIDISDWSNYKGGQNKAAANPRYCYEWAFIEPGKIVALNFWFSQIEELDGTISISQNLRDEAMLQKKPQWKTRGLKMDEIIHRAYREGLSVRVTILDGDKRDTMDIDAQASKVERRSLDAAPWSITLYNQNTGDCILKRGSFTDQFSGVTLGVTSDIDLKSEKKSTSSEAYVRNPIVRQNVLRRANGICDWCSQPGFITSKGDVYLETHHVVPLSEGGPDKESNVAALCPNHHREAHYGAIAEKMKSYLLSLLK